MENKTAVSLKSAEEILAAHERLAQSQFDGSVEPRAANAINTTLKAAAKLRIEYPLKYMAMVLQARIRKIKDIPKLPDGTLPIDEVKDRNPDGDPS